STSSFTPPPPEAYCWNSFRSTPRESGNRNHRGQRPLQHAGLRATGGSRHHYAIRRAERQLHSRHARRTQSRISSAAWTRPSYFTIGAELPSEHLRHEVARRGADHFPLRGRLPEGGTASTRVRRPPSVFLSHAPP